MPRIGSTTSQHRPIYSTSVLLSSSSTRTAIIQPFYTFYVQSTPNTHSRALSYARSQVTWFSTLPVGVGTWLKRLHCAAVSSYATPRLTPSCDPWFATTSSHLAGFEGPLTATKQSSWNFVTTPCDDTLLNASAVLTCQSTRTTLKRQQVPPFWNSWKGIVLAGTQMARRSLFAALKDVQHERKAPGSLLKCLGTQPSRRCFGESSFLLSADLGVEHKIVLC